MSKRDYICTRSTKKTPTMSAKGEIAMLKGRIREIEKKRMKLEHELAKKLNDICDKLEASISNNHQINNNETSTTDHP